MKQRGDDIHLHRLYSPLMSLMTRVLETLESFRRQINKVNGRLHSTNPALLQLANRLSSDVRSHADPTGFAATSVSIFQITLQR